jgi:hypothetical protein
MCGSGVQICMDRIQVGLKLTLPVRRQRPITSVVFVAVRGTSSIRAASGAPIVSGTILITGITTSAFVFPQDRARILFSGVAFSDPSLALVCSEIK